MHGRAVGEQDYAQIFSLLGNPRPAPDATVGLNLRVNGLDDRAQNLRVVDGRAVGSPAHVQKILRVLQTRGGCVAIGRGVFVNGGVFPARARHDDE